MTVLRRVEHAEERMDAPDVDGTELEHALRDVARVNRWLGGRRALLRHLPRALPHHGALQYDGARPARVLDVGTGSGDLPLAVSHWARRHGRDVRLVAVDRHAGTLDVAARRVGHLMPLARADALRLPFRDGSFDLALFSMTLHHMEGPDRVDSLRELGRVARGGAVLVGELHRSLPNWLGARFLAATLWRRSPVTRHDGPISVRRAFTPDELRELALTAGLHHPRVYRHPFYRLVLLAGA